MSPFQMLFKDFYEGYNGTIRGEPDEFIEMITSFLQHGQDPNTDIEPQSQSRCKSLHVVSCLLAKKILDYGADVNALDEKGFTPLDIAFGAPSKVFHIGDTRRSEGLSLPLLLMDHGGRVTAGVAASVEDVLRTLGRSIAIPDNRLRNPPGLSSAAMNILVDSHDTEGSEQSSSIPTIQNRGQSGLSRFRRAIPKIFKQRRN